MKNQANIRYDIKEKLTAIEYVPLLFPINARKLIILYVVIQNQLYLFVVTRPFLLLSVLYG